MNSAILNGVEKVVVLSTDKAVYPINAMGQTKALMEKVMIAKSRTIKGDKTILCATRYGNVMASRGSVIPLFISQMLKDESLTITDPAMTRFLMSLDESVDLVLYAFQNGKQGDIYVQKSPASTIEDLLKALQEIFCKANNINVIGTRHGEKLYETLVSREEMVRAEDCGKYFRIPSDNRDLNYSAYTTDGLADISSAEDYTSHNTSRLSVQELKILLRSLDYIKTELLRIK